MDPKLGIEITNEDITFADGINDCDGCVRPHAEDVELHACTRDPDWLLALLIAEIARGALKHGDPDVTPRQMRWIVATEIGALESALAEHVRDFYTRVNDDIGRVKAHNTSFSGGTKGEEKECEDA
jgi:hypothetical protein